MSTSHLLHPASREGATYSNPYSNHSLRQPPLTLFVTIPDANLRSSKKRKLSADDAYIDELRALPSPSESSKSWKQSEDNPIFLNHRPYGATGTPTELMHPAFGQFLDDCRSITPSPADFQLAHVLAETMAGYFPNELDRLTAFADVLQEHASLPLYGITLKRSATDLTLTTGRYIVLVLNVEGKKEPGASGNPFIQNLGYYANHLMKSSVSPQCRMPMFLVCLEGMLLGVGLHNPDLPDITNIYVYLRAEIKYLYGRLWRENHRRSVTFARPPRLLAASPAPIFLRLCGPSQGDPCITTLLQG